MEDTRPLTPSKAGTSIVGIVVGDISSSSIVVERQGLPHMEQEATREGIRGGVEEGEVGGASRIGHRNSLSLVPRARLQPTPRHRLQGPTWGA